LTKAFFINILRFQEEQVNLKTIFIVDDSDTNLLMAEEALEDCYRVMTLPSADKMFSLLDKITPDLILLDIEMPVMNGFEALEKLKAGNWADIPVIFLTGTTDYSIEEKSKKLGAAGIISKPFSEILLHEIINSHI
jgi:putative two-component system response regulator